MRGAGPLAVDNFVKVIGCRNISRFHSYLVRADGTVDAAFDVSCERSSTAFLLFLKLIMGLMNRRHSI
jgi:hypothetical protein